GLPRSPREMTGRGRLPALISAKCHDHPDACATRAAMPPFPVQTHGKRAGVVRPGGTARRPTLPQAVLNAIHDLKPVPRPVPQECLAVLADRFGNRFTQALAVREHHGRDESPYPPMLPDGVIFATSTEDVSAAARICNDYRVPLIAFGV